MNMKCSYGVFLLVLLIEECAEVIQRACKAIRFGLQEKWKEADVDNQEMLQNEINDLQAVLEMNYRAGILKYRHTGTREKMQTKKLKTEKFVLYSRDICKTLIPEGEEGPKNEPTCYEVYKASVTDTPL